MTDGPDGEESQCDDEGGCCVWGRLKKETYEVSCGNFFCISVHFVFFDPVLLHVRVFCFSVFHHLP